METRKFAKILEIDGHEFCVWLEPDGDEWIRHIACYVVGLGLVDVALTFTVKDGDDEKAWLALDDIENIESAAREQIKTAKDFLESLDAA